MARRNNNAFEKRMREQAKRERQEAKKQRKAERDAVDEDGEAAEPVEDQEQLMAQLAELHRRYDDEEISLEELEEQRAEITERMTIR